MNKTKYGKSFDVFDLELLKELVRIKLLNEFFVLMSLLYKFLNRRIINHFSF